MIEAAKKHFRKSDIKIAALIKAVGPCAMAPKKQVDPYDALTRSIVYQQLSTKAAATIYGRVKALTPGSKFPTPAEILKLPDSALRAAGLSRGKTSYIKDLAAHALAGKLPKARAIKRMSDAELAETLTAVKGVGLWSVEMYLIFTLCRPDVLPATDLGIRKGFAKVYGLADLPLPKELLAYGERWRPYRTVASWYLWRSLELRNLRKDAL